MIEETETTRCGQDSPDETGSIFDRECCPLCGGTSGFHYILTIKGLQFQPWKGGDRYEASFESYDNSAKHGAYRCQDCGKIIKSNP